MLIPLAPIEVQRALVAEMQAAREARNEKLQRAEQRLASLDAYLLDTLGLLGWKALAEAERLTYAATLGDILRSGRCDALFHAPRYQRLEKEFARCAHRKLKIGEISQELAGGATPTKGDSDPYADDGIKFLRILNVKANEFDLSDLKYIRPEVHERELKRSQLQVDDVLLTITGRVGNAAVVTAHLLPAISINTLSASVLRVPPCFLNTSRFISTHPSAWHFQTVA